MGRRIALAGAALVVYAAMWVGYVADWAWLAVIDDSLLKWAHDFGTAHPAWVTGWNVFCFLLGPLMFRLIGVVVIIWLLARRRVRPAMFLVISVELSGLVAQVAKELADRPRPATALVIAPSSSFPSGHAVGVMVGVLALLTVLWPALRPNWRLPAVVLSTVVVIGVGVGRVVLNVHHPSDVIAGWALGYVYYLLCALILGVRSPIAQEYAACPEGQPDPTDRQRPAV